jgi:16S rRNA (cytidine1402-2'-O)-methyltransferase
MNRPRDGPRGERFVSREADTAPGVLYLVPTPIGNEADITSRAVEVLKAADLVAAEDTRSAQTLLRRLGLHKSVVSYFDHNEASRAPWLVEQLAGGRTVALISEAGTPVVNDPGFRVIDGALAAGLEVTALPGACAAITALVASGLPTHHFSFLGFLPRAGGERQRAIEAVRRLPYTLIFYEAPHRVAEALGALEEGLGDRRASLAFEMTKPREQHLRGKLSEIRARIAQGEGWMGEMTLVVAGAEEGEGAPWERAEALMRSLLGNGVEARVVRDAVTAAFDLPRRAVYQRVLEIQKEE